MRWLIPLILAITGCSGVPYSNQDRIAFAAFVTAGAVDAYSTAHALDRGCRETNPFLGDHPSDGDLVLLKVCATGVFYLMGEIWPESRQQFYWTGAVISGGAAVWNSQQP